MWARHLEIILGIWLFCARFLLNFGDYNFKVWDVINPLLVITLAIACYCRKIRKLHLLQIAPAIYFIHQSFTYYTYVLPFGLQNYILVALLLLIVAIIPTEASQPPIKWRDFL